MSLPRPVKLFVEGVLTLSSICAASKTFPFSVLSPTANTRITPWPSIIFVPRMAWLPGNVASLSNSGRIGGLVAYRFSGQSRFIDVERDGFKQFAVGRDSSPVLRMTMSPTTTSCLVTCVTQPLRITCTGSSSLIWLSRANSFVGFLLEEKCEAGGKAVWL